MLSNLPSPPFLSSVALFEDGSKLTLPSSWEHSVTWMSYAGFHNWKEGHMNWVVPVKWHQPECTQSLEPYWNISAFHWMGNFTIAQGEKGQMPPLAVITRESTLPELHLEAWPTTTIAPKWHLHIFLQRVISYPTTAPKRRQSSKEEGREGVMLYPNNLTLVLMLSREKTLGEGDSMKMWFK